MKRCPQCLFLYPESDERCDFDKTLLEVVDDAEIEAATRPSKSSKRPRRVLPYRRGCGSIARRVCVCDLLRSDSSDAEGRRGAANVEHACPRRYASTCNAVAHSHTFAFAITFTISKSSSHRILECGTHTLQHRSGFNQWTRNGKPARWQTRNYVDQRRKNRGRRGLANQRWCMVQAQRDRHPVETWSSQSDRYALSEISQ